MARSRRIYVDESYAKYLKIQAVNEGKTVIEYTRSLTKDYPVLKLRRKNVLPRF